MVSQFTQSNGSQCGVPIWFLNHRCSIGHCRYFNKKDIRHGQDSCAHIFPAEEATAMPELSSLGPTMLPRTTENVTTAGTTAMAIINATMLVTTEVAELTTNTTEVTNGQLKRNDKNIDCRLTVDFSSADAARKYHDLGARNERGWGRRRKQQAHIRPGRNSLSLRLVPFHHRRGSIGQRPFLFLSYGSHLGGEIATAGSS